MALESIICDVNYLFFVGGDCFIIFWPEGINSSLLTMTMMTTMMMIMCKFCRVRFPPVSIAERTPLTTWLIVGFLIFLLLFAILFGLVTLAMLSYSIPLQFYSGFYEDLKSIFSDMLIFFIKLSRFDAEHDKFCLSLNDSSSNHSIFPNFTKLAPIDSFDLNNPLLSLPGEKNESKKSDTSDYFAADINDMLFEVKVLKCHMMKHIRESYVPYIESAKNLLFQLSDQVLDVLFVPTVIIYVIFSLLYLYLSSIFIIFIVGVAMHVPLGWKIYTGNHEGITSMKTTEQGANLFRIVCYMILFSLWFYILVVVIFFCAGSIPYTQICFYLQHPHDKKSKQVLHIFDRLIHIGPTVGFGLFRMYADYAENGALQIANQNDTWNAGELEDFDFDLNFVIDKRPTNTSIISPKLNNTQTIKLLRGSSETGDQSSRLKNLLSP